MSDRGIEAAALRIAVLGNMGNNAYRTCRWMHEMGWAPDLYLMPHDKGERSRPESVDRSLDPNDYPDWIRSYRRLDARWLPQPNADAANIEREYDVVLTVGPGIRAAPHFSRLPVVHMSLGGDVNQMPWRLWRRDAVPRARKDALMVRIGLRRVRSILTGFEPDIASLARLGHLHKTHVWGFPDDIRGNGARVDAALRDELTAQYAGYDRILLWLSRVNFLDPGAPDYKGVEKFVEAARRLVVDERRKLRLLIGAHGNHVDALRTRLTEAGLDGHVDWVPHLPYWKLLTYLSIPNAIVLDEIVPHMGEISGMAREALSVGALVVKTIDRKLIDACFGEGYPLPSIDDADSCHRELTTLIDMPVSAFDRLRSRGQEWALAHLHYEHQIPKLVSHLYDAWYVERFRQGAERPPRRFRVGDVLPFAP